MKTSRFCLLFCLAISFAFAYSNDWQLVWSDEFNGSSLDSSKWNVEVNCDGGGNAELQCYTNRASNVRVADGNLILTAIPENYNGRKFTSGRVNTKGHAAWLHGRFETRAILPKGAYLWPAIWMLPRDMSYGGWAASGEIDIMEQRGQLPNQVQSTIHYSAAYPNNRHTGSGPVAFYDFSTDFHTFVLEWDANQLRFFVDGKNYHNQTLQRNFWEGAGKNPYNGNAQPFDKPFYFLLNLAVDGKFFGAQANALTQTMARGWAVPSMTVDYVRVYTNVNTPAPNKPTSKAQTTKTSTTKGVTNKPTTTNKPATTASNGNKCNGVTFNAAQFSCVVDSFNKKNVLCPVNSGACNGACYSKKTYSCAANGSLKHV